MKKCLFDLVNCKRVCWHGCVYFSKITFKWPWRISYFFDQLWANICEKSIKLVCSELNTSKKLSTSKKFLKNENWTFLVVPYLTWKPEIANFFCLRTEIRFLRKFGPNTQNCHFKLKIGYWIKSNMQKSMAVFTFFLLGWKYSYWANLIWKIKNASLSWNLVPRLIPTCKIQCWCSLFFVFDRK